MIRLRKVRGWFQARPFLSAFLVMALLVTAGFYRTQQIADRQQAQAQQQQDDNAQRIADNASLVRALRDDLRCFERWANGSTKRNKKLQPYANARIDDLLDGISAALDGKTTRARKLATKAVRAQKHYKAIGRRNPIKYPRLNCHLTVPQPRPAREPTRTVTAPAPRRSTVTRTVQDPQPARTVIRTRVIYRTVTVPPGHRRRKGHR